MADDQSSLANVLAALFGGGGAWGIPSKQPPLASLPGAAPDGVPLASLPDAFEAAAQRVRAPYAAANARESGLPQVGEYFGNKLASALTAPRDAFTGAMPVNDPATGMPTPEAMQRGQGVANLAMTGGIPMAERGALGMAGGKLMQHGPRAYVVAKATEEGGRPIVLGIHATPEAAAAHQESLFKSAWDKDQREIFDEPEDREPYPGREAFLEGQKNAHGEIANPHEIPQIHESSLSAPLGKEAHVVATGVHDPAVGATGAVEVHGAFPSKEEARAAADLVARQKWESGHGDNLGSHEDKWASALEGVVARWNKAHPEEQIDAGSVGMNSEVAHAHPQGYEPWRSWYEDRWPEESELPTVHYLPEPLAREIDALEGQTIPYPGLNKATRYWRDDASDAEHHIPVITPRPVMGQ